MSKFVKCPVETILVDGNISTNCVVNIDLCTSIKKWKKSRKHESKNIATLYFDGCNIEWNFNSEEQRDRVYRELMILVDASSFSIL